jgi:hypothetical protein
MEAETGIQMQVRGLRKNSIKDAVVRVGFRAKLIGGGETP